MIKSINESNCKLASNKILKSSDNVAIKLEQKQYDFKKINLEKLILEKRKKYTASLCLIFALIGFILMILENELTINDHAYQKVNR
jgi:hypothetical protein